MIFAPVNARCSLRSLWCDLKCRAALECGDLSPLSLPERLVAQAEPRRAARRIFDRLSFDTRPFSVRRTAGRGAARTTCRRTPYFPRAAPTLSGTFSHTAFTPCFAPFEKYPSLTVRRREQQAQQSFQQGLRIKIRGGIGGKRDPKRR